MGFLSGCSPLQKDFRSKNYFSLEIAPLERPESEVPDLLPKGLLIRELAISPEFATSFFVYQISPVQYEEDYYNQFMVPPARMITNLLRENLYDAGLFRPVFQGNPADIDFRLWGKIVHLYVDMKDIAHPYCVLSMRLILEKQETGVLQGESDQEQGFAQVVCQLYEARVPVASNTPGKIALGWSECLHQILSQFYEDMQDQEISVMKSGGRT